MIDTLFSTDLGARLFSFGRGHSVFHRGQPSTSIFRIVSGRLRLTRTTREGREITLATAGPGETMAEAALFSDRYHCDAVAAEASEVWAAPCERLRRYMQSHPEAALAFAAHVSRQVRDLRTRLEMREIKNAAPRVLAWIELNADAGVAAPRNSWAKVATEIGLTPEALYRALRTLEAEGAIRRNGDRAIQVVRV